MLPQCSHITRKRGVYYYRRRMPWRSKGELTLSLRTRSFREAQWLATGLDRELLKVIANVSETTEGKPDLQRIARDYLKRKLNFDMERRHASPHRPVYNTPADEGASSVADLEWVEGELQTARTELRERLYEHQGPLIDELMAGNALPPQYRNAFAHAVFQANVAFWETVRRRTLGDFSSRPEEPRQTDPARQPEARPEDKPTGPSLSHVLPGFFEFMSEHQGWRGQTLAQNSATCKMFVECCGDRPIAAYERKDLAAFYDLLRALPKLYSKSKEWRELSLAEIASRSKEQDCERLTIKTIKRHFSALGRLFAYLIERGEYTADNPAYGFSFPDKRRTREKRSMWESEQLTKLFASPVWTGCLSESRRSRPGTLILKDDKYWLPLLGVYHGNRLEEFAQLLRSDVRQEGGIWFLDVNDEGDKQLKNEQSKRRVPLHPVIQRLGLLEYVESAAPRAEDRVFPFLRPGGPDKKLGYYFSKWWSNYRKDVGLYQKGVDYHSFRATVATKLAEAGVSLEIRNELLGHEGSSVDERSYQKGFPLKLLAEAIARVSWPELCI